MKKIFLLICTLFAFCTLNAEVLKLQTTSYAYKYETEYGNWTDWTDWIDTSVLVVINLDTDRINIYSSTPQEYDVIQDMGSEADYEGGETYRYKCVDGDGTICEIRLRVESSGSLQLYVDYSDISWVYNVIVK